MQNNTSFFFFFCKSSSAPEMLQQWKFLQLSKKKFSELWISKCVYVCISLTNNTQVRGEKINRKFTCKCNL